VLIFERADRGKFIEPLRRGHHRAAHRSGDETTWWRQIGIDPTKMALQLWGNTRSCVAPRRRNRRPFPTQPACYIPASWLDWFIDKFRRALKLN